MASWVSLGIKHWVPRVPNPEWPRAHGVMICEWTNSRSDWISTRFCRKSGPAIVCGRQLLTTLSAATGSVLGQGLISSKGSFHSVVHTKRSRPLFCAIGLQPQWVQLLGQFQPPCSLWPSCLATWGSQCFLAVLDTSSHQKCWPQRKDHTSRYWQKQNAEQFEAIGCFCTAGRLCSQDGKSKLFRENQRWKRSKGFQGTVRKSRPCWHLKTPTIDATLAAVRR